MATFPRIPVGNPRKSDHCSSAFGAFLRIFLFWQFRLPPGQPSPISGCKCARLGRALAPYPPCTPWVHATHGQPSWPRASCTQGVQGGHGARTLCLAKERRGGYPESLSSRAKFRGILPRCRSGTGEGGLPPPPPGLRPWRSPSPSLHAGFHLKYEIIALPSPGLPAGSPGSTLPR